MEINRIHIIILCLIGFGFSAQSQELNKLIEEALENSPEIQKFELQYQITSEKVNEVNTIPNTEFGIGYFVSVAARYRQYPTLSFPPEKFSSRLYQP